MKQDTPIDRNKAMEPEQSDWEEELLDNATFAEIRNRSPLISSSRPPTIQSPDGTRLYLPSQDVDVPVANSKTLEIMLESVLETFQCAIREHDYRRTFTASVDAIELCRHLYNCSESPERYIDPDLIIETARLAAESE